MSNIDIDALDSQIADLEARMRDLQKADKVATLLFRNLSDTHAATTQLRNLGGGTPEQRFEFVSQMNAIATR